MKDDIIWWIKRGILFSMCFAGAVGLLFGGVTGNPMILLYTFMFWFVAGLLIWGVHWYFD